MKRNRIATVASLVVSAGLFSGAAALAAPAQADPSTDQFLSDLGTMGLTGIDPATATSLGQQVCPMLAQPGQDLADVAAQVADEMGRPLGPATMFTGLAISIFCPGAVASLANGESPIPLGLLG
jgi:Protein of unknown function (DUF732)